MIRLASLAAAAAFGFLGLADAPAEAVEIQEVTSPGGIKALLVEDHTNPLIAMRFSFAGAGATQDAPGKEGTANLLSGLLDEGAGEIPSAAFQEKLDDLGVSLAYSAGYDDFSGSFRAITDFETEAFDLLRLSLNAPRFDEEPVNRIRGQIETGIRADSQDPGERLGEAWRETIFPDHPYSRPVEGTIPSLESVTAEDLRGFAKSKFTRGNLVVGVVGAIDAQTLGQRLDEVFGGLAEAPDLAPVADVVPATGKRVDVDAETPQASIQLALPGLPRDHPDYFAAYLVNQILGGGSFTSRLYQEIRERRGLAYGAGSSLASFDHAALLSASTTTRADKAEEVVALMRDELKRMAEEGPTEAELAAAKSYVKGAYAVRNLDSSLAVASTLVTIQLDDLGTDYIDRREAEIDAVTIEDARRVAKTLLSPEPTVITVGPAGA
ncbi:M16 family metallopeptidase [Antarcticirhabdus aurantiaca]|uniref:Pitrilysin family protein n=1 Tax=Antarcticirhabdus aurantiaca TaxID=2606717 RepID=A0ACD4NLP0_9HYPH|nr:pitrilysin family protein [Antarcticirhabdus aurantiaca]WAJ27703.1 pitrilysin family protein [Jeongeuplla avenae]